MEKRLEDLSILEEYHNRQTVLNYYHDDDFLWKRDGFYFQSIVLTDEDLIFRKENESIITIPLKGYTSFTINSDFQNYYFFRSGSDRLELYFPL
jgi:hypothetical protein